MLRRMTTKFLMGLLGVIANAAYGAGVSQDCSAIKDSQKRLECFDGKSQKPPDKKPTVSNESLARKSVLASLKDPDSARFGKFTLATANTSCLTVNARNAYGGYTGEQQALLAKLEGQWFVITIEEKINHAQCIDVAIKLNEKQ